MQKTYFKHVTLDRGADPEAKERIHILSNLLMPWDLTGSSGGCGWGEGQLGYFALPAASATQNHIKDGKWTDDYSVHSHHGCRGVCAIYFNNDIHHPPN